MLCYAECHIFVVLMSIVVLSVMAPERFRMAGSWPYPQLLDQAVKVYQEQTV